MDAARRLATLKVVERELAPPGAAGDAASEASSVPSARELLVRVRPANDAPAFDFAPGSAAAAAALPAAWLDAADAARVERDTALRAPPSAFADARVVDARARFGHAAAPTGAYDEYYEDAP